MPHVWWHCNGVGNYSRYSQRDIEFHANGMSFFEWIPPLGMADAEIARINRKLEHRQAKQLEIIAAATGGEINGSGVGPVEYRAAVKFPLYKYGMATYNWLPPHPENDVAARAVDAKLERLRQQQLEIIADATGGAVYGNGAVYEGYGPYPHRDESPPYGDQA